MNQTSYYYPAYPYERNANTANTYPVATDGTYPQDERFFFAPFVVGGLAGTALGYGIANNNQINKGCCMQPVYYYPINQQMPAPYMYSSNSNNFYY